MRPSTRKYNTLGDLRADRDSVPWYWQFIALASSWMILGGYLILPATYDSDPQLRFSKGVLSIFIVALLTAGYSFTALLCFACRSWIFQADSIFLPTTASSALGTLTPLWCLASSHRYKTSTPFILSLVLPFLSTLLYGSLYLLQHRRIARLRASSSPSGPSARSANLWQDPSFYQNFIANMYPSARSGAAGAGGCTEGAGGFGGEVLSDEDMVNQQMAMLLMKADPDPSPDASSSTFRIDLPPADEEEGGSPATWRGTAPPRTIQEWYERAQRGDRSVWAAPAAVEGAEVRGRSEGRDGVGAGTGDVGDGGREGRSRGHSRAVSREERRREIELGRL